MDNKNYINAPSFNANNIAKSLNLQKLSQLSQRRKKFNIFKLSPQSQVGNIEHESSLRNTESEFNDFNLKYGKSQTLKQPISNKTRLHTRRRNKNNKWMENSPKNQGQQLQSIKANKLGLFDDQIDQSQKNSLFLKRRKLIGLTYNRVKNKTSPQEIFTSNLQNQKQQNKNIHMFVDQNKMNQIINKLRAQYKTQDQNLEQSHIKNITKKYRLLSKPLKFDFLKVKNQNLFKQTDTSTKQADFEPYSNKMIESIDSKGKQLYQAWEESKQIQASCDEIVQYTQQRIINQTITHSSNKNKNAVSSSKNKCKYFIRKKR